MNYGANLQVTPILGGNTQQIILDLRSVLTIPLFGNSAKEEMLGFSFESHEMRVQQFMSSVKLDVGKPTLIVGASAEPATQSAHRVYLVVEAVLGN